MGLHRYDLMCFIPLRRHTHVYTGRIICRFDGNSTELRNNMRSLGEFLRSQQRPDYQPYFSIKEKADDPDLNTVTVTTTTLDGESTNYEERLRLIGRRSSI